MIGSSPSAALIASKSAAPGPLTQWPLLRGRLGRGDLPGGLEPPEMVDAHDVHDRQRALDPLDPPAVAVLRHHVPAVVRIAPALPGFREVVRRHAGDHGGVAFAIQFELIGPRPHVRAVLGYEDRDVADDLDTQFVGALLQRAPLISEEPLHILVIGRPLADLAAVVGQCARLAHADIARPVVPASAAEIALQRHEEAVVGQPGSVLLLEGAEPGALLRRGCGVEVLEAAPEQRLLVRDHRAEVYLCAGSSGTASNAPAGSSPERTNPSGLISSGLPANAEKH